MVSTALLAAFLATQAAPPAAPSDGPAWTSMFDGKTLQGWKETAFAGHGKVRVEDGAIVLGAGAMTGVTWTKPFPKDNFEFRLEAMKVDGSDFFAGITFPVHDSFLSWINGGWGGMTVGLSSLDDLDASENDLTYSKVFDTGKWYAFRLRLVGNQIQAWIDNELIIDADLSKRKVALRPGEIDMSCPFGIAAYWTTAKLRKIEYREIPPAK